MSELKSWRSIKNPWAGKFEKNDEVFVFAEDRAPVENYNAKKTENLIHQENPPQPFQGTPDAEVWFLVLNPGYDESDTVFYSDRARPDRRDAILRQLAFEQPDKNHYWHKVNQ